jgi:prepilin-type processing-associated H-X9-DG protein
MDNYQATGAANNKNTYGNSPSIRHGNAMTLSFADGHVGLISFNKGEKETFTQGNGGVPAKQMSDWITFYKTVYPYP